MKSSFLPSILLEILKVESVNIETPSTPDGLSTLIYLFIISPSLKRNLKTYGSSLVKALSKDWKHDLEQAALFPEWAPLFGFRLVTKHAGGGLPEVKLFSTDG